jgi:hypothetical protein
MWLHSAQTVDDLLADPLIQMVMQADRVDAPALRGLFSGVATQIADDRRKRSLDFSGARVRFGAEPRSASALLHLAPPSPLADCEGRICC